MRGRRRYLKTPGKPGVRFGSHEIAQHSEVLEFVERHGLAGSGIGWVDVHLLVSAALSGVGIWTLDRRLSIAAQRLSLFA